MNGEIVDMKKFLKIFAVLLVIIIAAAALLVIFLSVTEYRPADTETAQSSPAESSENIEASDDITILSWNTGFGGLGKESDFFMDGGEMVYPPSQEIVEKNVDGISDFLENFEADIYILQEVDYSSDRTERMDQISIYSGIKNFGYSYARNYMCEFVPFPIPPLGKMDSGIMTMSEYAMDAGVRISLPCPFSWPVSTANLKRCLLVNRFTLEGSDKELVVVNLHLEAYDNGEGKAAQTEALMEVLTEEYEKGNYVIAGGDFNQTFSGALDSFPILDDTYWQPGTLEDSALPDGWAFAYDASNPTCRLLNKPYSGEDGSAQYYVIDGFILSPNIELNEIETIDLGFEYADHNPVKLEFKLIKE